MKYMNTVVVAIAALLLASPLAAQPAAMPLQQAAHEGKVEVKVSSLGGATGNTVRVDVRRKVLKAPRGNHPRNCVSLPVGHGAEHGRRDRQGRVHRPKHLSAGQNQRPRPGRRRLARLSGRVVLHGLPQRSAAPRRPIRVGDSRSAGQPNYESRPPRNRPLRSGRSSSPCGWIARAYPKRNCSADTAT